MYFLQYSKFAFERPQVRTWGRQTCFFPRAPTNLATALLASGLRRPPPSSRGCFRSECWGWVNCSTTREPYHCTHPSTSNTRLDSLQAPFCKSSVWPYWESNAARQLWWRVPNQLYHWTGWLRKSLSLENCFSNWLCFSACLVFFPWACCSS